MAANLSVNGNFNVIVNKVNMARPVGQGRRQETVADRRSATDRIEGQPASYRVALHPWARADSRAARIRLSADRASIRLVLAGSDMWPSRTARSNSSATPPNQAEW